MTSEKVGFDATTLSFGASSVSGVFILFLGVSWWWQIEEEFDPVLLGYGLAASIFDTIGKAFVLNAWSVGPAGSVGAFCELTNVGLVIVEAVR